MSYEIKIKKVNNGYITSHFRDEDDYETSDVVFEIKNGMDCNKAEQECFVDLMLHLKEYFGIFYSKHNKTNINISIDDEPE